MYYEKFVDNFTDKHEPTKQYYENLELFYSPIAVCPKCKSKIDKSKEGDIIKLKCTKCKWKITIDVAKYVNIHDVLYSRKVRESNLMYELTEAIRRDQKVDLDELKLVGQYDIEHILDDQKAIIDKEVQNQFKNVHELYLLHAERKKIYFSIVEKINKGNRIKLMEGFKEGKSVDHMMKNTGLSKYTVEKWIEWLKVVKRYVLLIHEIRKTLNKIKQEKQNNIKLNTRFLVKSGSVTESKEIKM